MKEGYRMKWAPRLLDFVIFLVVLVVFCAIYGKLTDKFGSDSVMPIFVGLTAVVFVPLIVALKRKKAVNGRECPECKRFVKKL